MTRTDYCDSTCGDLCANDDCTCRCHISYGNWLIGSWWCKECSKEYFPRILFEEKTQPPFKCSCGGLLEYDEAA